MENNSLTNPLIDILLAASKNTSSKSSQEKVYQRDRHKQEQNYQHDRPQSGISSFDIQLLDISGSMKTTLENGSKKIEILSNILNQLPYCHLNYAFNSQVKQIKYSDILVAEGGTNLALALSTIQIHSPHKILIISDGMPDSALDCFEAAATLNCNISCFFVGFDSNTKAKDFLRKLSTDNSGKYEDCDITKIVEYRKLTQKIQNLLPGC